MVAADQIDTATVASLSQDLLRDQFRVRALAEEVSHQNDPGVVELGACRNLLHEGAEFPAAAMYVADDEMRHLNPLLAGVVVSTVTFRSDGPDFVRTSSRHGSYEFDFASSIHDVFRVRPSLYIGFHAS